MKKANNIMGKLDYFSSIDKLATDFTPKIIGASKTNYFDPYPNTWGRQVQRTLHVGPAQSKELNKKQLTELIHELKEKKIRAKKAEEDAREIHTLSKKFMNKPWSAVPEKYRTKYGNMDFDGDGLKNKKDCYPFDYDRQGWLEDSFKGIYDYFVPPKKSFVPIMPEPIVNITVGDKGTAKDVVWAGNIAASIAQSTSNPDIYAGNQGIANTINNANAAGANVIIGNPGKPISQITSIGGDPGGSAPPVPPVPYDPTVYLGDKLDQDKYDALLQQISDARFKDSKLAAQLEAKLKPYLDIYEGNRNKLDTTLKGQNKSLTQILERKNEQMGMLGGVNLANRRPYARAQEILTERSDRFQAARDAANKLEMDAYSKQDALINREHNRAVQDSIVNEMKARADEYTQHNVVLGETVPGYKEVPYSSLTPAQKADWDRINKK